MPCLNITTNVDLAGVDTGSMYADMTTAVSSIIGRPEKYVMVIVKGGVEITFGGNKEAAAFAEVVSMGGINSEVKKKLISSISAILETKLCISPTRFILKIHDTTAASPASKL